MTSKPNDVRVSRELLPCPFCGGEADTYCTESDYPDWFAQCKECGASADITGPYDLHFWNRRTQPADQQGEPEVTPVKKYDDTLLPFLALMRKELHANADKGDRPGWLSMSADTCLLEIIYHFGKLQASVKRGDGDGMAEYGADVANLCMMLLDVCGVINLVQVTAQPATAKVDERAEFARAFPDTDQRADGTFIHSEDANKWAAWQARAKLNTPL